MLLVIYLILAAWCIYWLLNYFKSKSSFLSKFLTVHISILLSLILVELISLGAHLDYRLILNTLGDEPWYHPMSTVDDELLHIHKPNQKISGKQATGDIGFYFDIEQPNTYTYNLETDSYGFRNKQTYQNTDIVVIGDSFVESVLTDYQDLFTTKLVELTGQKVSNLGQIWYGPQQELEVLKRFATALNPKIIVWMFFAGNDLSDYDRYQVVKPQLESIKAKRKSKLRKSFTRNLVKKIYVQTRKKNKPKALTLECKPQDQEFYFNYQNKAFSDQVQENLIDTQKLLQNAVDIANHGSAHLVIAYTPTKLEVMHKLCGQTKIDQSTKQAIMTNLESLHGNYSILDLTPMLTEASMQQATYLIDDTHWSNHGHQVVAETLYQHILNLETSK